MTVNRSYPQGEFQEAHRSPDHTVIDFRRRSAHKGAASLPWRTPALKQSVLYVHTYDDHQTPASTLSFFVPLPCLAISLPCPQPRGGFRKTGKQKMRPAVLVSERSRHHHWPRDMPWFSVINLSRRSTAMLPQGTRKLFGSEVPALPAQPTAPPAISALQGAVKKANQCLRAGGGWRACAYACMT